MPYKALCFRSHLPDGCQCSDVSDIDCSQIGVRWERTRWSRGTGASDDQYEGIALKESLFENLNNLTDLEIYHHQTFETAKPTAPTPITANLWYIGVDVLRIKREFFECRSNRWRLGR
jgi:hypothetical protein